MEHHNWDDALFLDEETAALLFAEAQKIVDVPDAPPEITEHQDAHALFLHFNDLYFGGALAGVERKFDISNRFKFFDITCAGLCCYEKGGYCVIKLSEPLLKFRPPKDLVQTLLHEMIHALLFVTKNNRDRDAHGPEFLSHMERINRAGGYDISVYHSFHDEVDFHRKHWWQCGKCKYIIKRAMNRAPGPYDWWWERHKNECGGEYIKIKEPPPDEKKRKRKSSDSASKDKPKPKGALDNYFKTEPDDGAEDSPAPKRRKIHEASEVKIEPKKEEKHVKSEPILILDDEDDQPKPKPKQPSVAPPESKEEKFSCPVCSSQYSQRDLNMHLDVDHQFE